ncbi:DUF6907 domain-containing protein [Streptosporangium pseudovulgare]|uniref:DUF5753 domain-containing protein n=1 Tax=Streptosporangium pseudovulgare TaxID=35765 RepID=A0ABQ2RCH0_9ACTN|nr:hypothetical protein [Streptosporangium pseudovulgare]GGQ20863.1 hypothetical protein GCM10010140_58910 [Streptosporangium pseudovulgare]
MDKRTTPTADRPADVEVPAWLTGPCPAWCSALHSASDHPDDRHHDGVSAAVELTTMDFINYGAPTRPNYRPQVALIDLIQGYREAEPRVCVVEGSDRFLFYLSLAEAEEFAGHLLQLVATARGESDPS